jgi:xanthine dehydrogenase molybdopterin-binding subunit B
MTVPGMLFGAFLFSPHPRMLVKRIDTTDAAAQAGVVRIVTAADVPGQRYQGSIYKDWPVFVAEGETTHCIGDILAAVAATTERAARAAIARIVIETTRCPVCSLRRRRSRPAPRACIAITTICCQPP